MSGLSHDGVFWRRLARLGARWFPEWFVRYAPALFGLLAALLVPSARRAVRRNLHRVRGPSSFLADSWDIVRTFTCYAASLTDVLSQGRRQELATTPVVLGMEHLRAVLEAGRGAVLVTAHTAGWELIGPRLLRDHGCALLVVMERERDDAARLIHDEARKAMGILVAHMHDPLASLPLLRHLRNGGLVALQIDRAAPGSRARTVRLFDQPFAMPEGPLRLAQLSGAPLVPVFAARLGYRRYMADIRCPVALGRRAQDADIQVAAQAMADTLTDFIRAHPTQWFDFGPHPRPSL
jgi:KDO2-lipid IV(A) lauroyltransferase